MIIHLHARSEATTMLRSLKDIEDYKVTAIDGDIGSVNPIMVMH